MEEASEAEEASGWKDEVFSVFSPSCEAASDSEPNKASFTIAQRSDADCSILLDSASLELLLLEELEALSLSSEDPRRWEAVLEDSEAFLEDPRWEVRSIISFDVMVHNSLPVV